jgi:hypothetical protein
MLQVPKIKDLNVTDERYKGLDCYRCLKQRTKLLQV